MKPLLALIIEELATKHDLQYPTCCGEVRLLENAQWHPLSSPGQWNVAELYTDGLVMELHHNGNNLQLHIILTGRTCDNITYHYDLADPNALDDLNNIIESFVT
jgi:hypothetical protein